MIHFESLNDFNKYIKVYISYIKIKDKIKEYNSGDTKNNKIFSLFEDLLFIGFHGYKTKYEYENSIIINEFSFNKFQKYNSEIQLKNNLRLIKLNTFKFNEIFVLHIKNDLFALIPNIPSNNKIIRIIKYDNLLNKSVKCLELVKYCYNYEYKDIPIKLRKYHIVLKDKEEVIKEIYVLGENQYLLAVKIYKTFNNVLLKYCYNEEMKEYIKEEISLDFITVSKNIKIIKISFLKNNKIIIFTEEELYIYHFNKEDNSFTLIKKFLNIMKLINKKDNTKLSESDLFIIKSKNGDFFFNHQKKLICISHKFYEIKCIINFNHFPHFKQDIIKEHSEGFGKIRFQIMYAAVSLQDRRAVREHFSLNTLAENLTSAKTFTIYHNGFLLAEISKGTVPFTGLVLPCSATPQLVSEPFASHFEYIDAFIHTDNHVKCSRSFVFFAIALQ